MKLLMLKGLNCLKPADRDSEQALSKYQLGDLIALEGRKPRNSQYHRWFFALLTVVLDNLPEELERQFPTVERLLIELKMQTGRFDTVASLSGKSYFIPHSISFAKMDQVEFEKFVSECISVIRKYILRGIAEHELREAVEFELQNFGV